MACSKAHAGKNPADQIKFMADQGFRAMFDNGIMGRPVPSRRRSRREMAKRGMPLGPFVLYADFAMKSFVTQDKAVRDMLLHEDEAGHRDG